MLQPHMIAVKLGRMEALSLPAGMGLWERPATCNLSGCRRGGGARDILPVLYSHCTSMLNRRVLLLYGTYLLRYESTAIVL